MPPPVPSARRLPVLAFHGQADPRISYADAQRSVRQLKAAGRAATLSSYEGVGHHIPPRMQRDLFAALREMLDLAARGPD
jgi:predicted esterase